MNDKTNWELLAKYFSGDATSTEKEEVEFWINENESNRKLFLSMKNMWDLPEESFEASNTKEILKRIKSETGMGSIGLSDNDSISKELSIFQIIYGSPLIKYAAAIIIVFSIFLVYYFATVSTSKEYLTLKVDHGDQKKIVLSDGSKITIDAGSTLKYPETFNKDYREIELQGEAFFEVEHIQDLPFRVIAEHAIIQVLGTKFNISTFNENKDVNVFVGEGKISLSSLNDSSQKQILSNGQFSSVDIDGKLSKITTESIESKLSWLSGQKYFENVVLGDVLNQIERWYDVHFEYDKNIFEKDALTIVVHKNSLADMLEIISGLTSLNYSIEGKKVSLF